jgi:hypothetical protein
VGLGTARPFNARGARSARGGQVRNPSQREVGDQWLAFGASRAATRWNLEIAGIIALGFALLLGITLVAPPGRTGVIGGATRSPSTRCSASRPDCSSVLIALIAAIVFLEINVPKMIATLGGAACAYFI